MLCHFNYFVCNTEWNGVNCGNTNEMSMWPSQWIAIQAIAKIARKKDFRGFNGIRTRGLCVSAAVLSQLSYEDPYTGGWPIYWVHQPVKGMKHWMKWCELREYKIFFSGYFRNCLNCDSLRWSHTHFISFVVAQSVVLNNTKLWNISQKIFYRKHGSRYIRL